MGQRTLEPATDEWVAFPGGELEGKRPKVLCPACREALKLAARRDRGMAGRPTGPRLLCFQCYRADLDRDRALKAAGDLDTTSDERFQYQLPLEAVNRPRLEMLKVDRAEARAATSPQVNARRHAQIEARHALHRIAAGLRARGFAAGDPDRERAIFQAVHAAELQLPDSWLPFVVSR